MPTFDDFDANQSGILELLGGPGVEMPTDTIVLRGRREVPTNVIIRRDGPDDPQRDAQLLYLTLMTALDRTTFNYLTQMILSDMTEMELGRDVKHARHSPTAERSTRTEPKEEN